MLLGLLALALVVLSVTGVWLWFRYEPTASAAWNRGGHDEGWIRVTHRWVGHVVVLLALLALVVVIVRRVRSQVRGVVAGVGVLVTALAASITGYLLPWDQLALWAVTVGDDVRGTQATFRSEVKFILIGSREVSPGTYRFWAITHVVLGVLVAVSALLSWLRGRDRGLSRPSPSPPPPAPPPGLEPQPVH